MKRNVPKKNISNRIEDIGKPRRTSPGAPPREDFPDDAIKLDSAAAFAADNEYDPEKRIDEDAVLGKKFSPLKKISLVVVAVGAIAASWFGVRLYAQWSQLQASLKAADTSIGAFSRNANYQGIAGNEAGKPEAFFEISRLSAVPRVLQNLGKVYQSIGTLSSAAFDAAQQVGALESGWTNIFLSRKGNELLVRLRSIKEDLGRISEANKTLASADLGAEQFLPGSSFRLSLGADLNRAENFLGVLLSWLDSPRAHHIAVFFENSSELRPGGGFIGSYADAMIEGGSVASIEVHDINDADRELEEKIVPPKPLQAIASRWRAADANWFFDFARSSEKVIGLMEASKKYRAGGITFDGAVAISPKVISDLLAATGPVSLRNGRLTIDKDNFLSEIQKEVQAGQQGKGAPKKILEELTPLILEKLGGLPASERKAMLGKFGGWLTRKDAMLYFKDQSLESFIDFYGFSGKVFGLPKNENVDYLAAVHANVGGGKTDLFMKQTLSFRSQLNLDGTATDHLAISREHQGNKASSWWYRVQNQDYLEVFTAPGAALSNFSGGWNRTIYPKVNYAKSGYAVDPLVQEIEAGAKKDFNFPLVNVFQDSDKNVFATWVKTDPGKTSKVSFDYSVRLFTPPSDGKSYQFVFEKQAGSTGSYQFELYAPVGFRWKENKLPVFEYKTDDPPGRLVFNLTFEKDR